MEQENTQIAQEQKPVEEAPQENKEQVQEQPKPSVLERVSKAPNKPAESIQTEEKFDYKEIENIKDPEARAYAEKAYKSFEKGYQQKYQDLAKERKALEQQGEWTPDRVQSLLNDQKFVEAAQQVAQSATSNQSGGSMTDDEWSALTDSEKSQMKNMQSKIDSMFHQNQMMALNQEHEQNKSRYANYDAKLVENFRTQLLNGKYRATSEDLWKSMDYENAVNRAYQLGLEDRQNNISEKIGNTSIDGVNAQAATDTPKKEEGENNHAYFKRLANFRLQQMGTAKK